MIDFAPAAARLLLTITLTLPLLFGGIAFSTEVKTRTAISGALSANLLGAMLGGFLEYNSMVLGFEALWGIAFGAYALAALASLRAR